ncbi:multiprotein-bridging factor 1 family protein [Bradyrhizobium sp. Ec3.3]|uniref:helix-turn-helix domain-containing protein n=1 Tax=Bradyrhizobium sp. Ec3.3 TaxID=189753 RepID=UPI003529382D
MNYSSDSAVETLHLRDCRNTPCRNTHQGAALPVMKIREVLALNVRKLRQARGLSQEELAHRAKIDRTYVNSIERCHYSAGVDEDLLRGRPGKPLRPTRNRASPLRARGRPLAIPSKGKLLSAFFKAAERKKAPPPRRRG